MLAFPSLPRTSSKRLVFSASMGAENGFRQLDEKKTLFAFHEALVSFYRNPDFRVLKNNPSKTGQFLANPPCLPKPTTSHILVVSNTWLGSTPQDAIVTKMTLHVYARESPSLATIGILGGVYIQALNRRSLHWFLSPTKGHKKNSRWVQGIQEGYRRSLGGRLAVEGKPIS